MRPGAKGAAVGIVLAAGALALGPWARERLRVRRWERDLAALASLRAAVEKAHRTSGRRPSRLEDLGPVPVLSGLPRKHAPTAETLLFDLGAATVRATFTTPPLPAGSKPTLEGDFRGRASWERVPLECDDAGCWTSVDLEPGRYTYGLVTNGPGHVMVAPRDIGLRPDPRGGDGLTRVRALEGLPDEGRWAYDPARGEVFIACTCEGADGRGRFTTRPPYAY